MQKKIFEYSKQIASVIHEMGEHMPGGFFIYKAEPPEEVLYANKPVLDIYGCESLEDFKKRTGATFRGMVHPEDYSRISDFIAEHIKTSDEHMDYVEYRIVRKDGAVRWVDDYFHHLNTDAFGEVYTVFISDITRSNSICVAHT